MDNYGFIPNSTKAWYIVSPCPWCEKTPKFFLQCEGKTWIWYLKCCNYECKMSPKSKHCSIRKNGKKMIGVMFKKLCNVVYAWNYGNKEKAYEKTIVDFSNALNKNT